MLNLSDKTTSGMYSRARSGRRMPAGCQARPALLLVVAGLVATATPLVAGESRAIPSAIPGAPDHAIPLSALDIAASRMREILSEKLSETLDMPETDAGDLQRLMMIAAAADQAVPSGVSPDDDAGPGSRLDHEAVTSDGGSPDIDPDSVRALAALLTALQEAGFGQDLHGMRSSGGHRGQDPTPASLPGPASTADANILLRGWNIVMRQNGETYLFRDDSPGSGIQLEEGLVIGALGPVSDIRRIGREVHVSFGNGSTISGIAESMMPGIPPLPSLTALDAAPGEIMLSGPPPVASRRAEGDPLALHPGGDDAPRSP